MFGIIYGIFGGTLLSTSANSRVTKGDGADPDFSEGCGDGAGYLSGPLGRVRVRVTRVGRGHVGLTLRERPARARPTRLHAPARTHEPFRPRRGLLLEGGLRAVRGRRERTGREAAAAKSSRLQSIGLHRNPTRPNKLHHNSRNKVPSTAHNRTKQQNSARASTRLSQLAPASSHKPQRLALPPKTVETKSNLMRITTSKYLQIMSVCAVDKIL